MIKNKIQQYIPKDAVVEFFDNVAIFEVTAIELENIISDYCQKFSLKMITASDERKENNCFRIWYIFAIPQENIFLIPFLRLDQTFNFPSLSPIIHEAWNYERKIKTFFGLNPVGHPDQQPIILHENWPADTYPLRKDFVFNTHPKFAHGDYKFQKVDGEGIYEIPVGPIHAGIIEPGHFRFSVAGELIVLLESRLGFTHKGSEKLFEVLTVENKIKLSEKISGDSSFSHSLAFCQALEKLSNVEVSKRAQYLRVIYAELERLANHFGDIGAIMTDAGFNFGGAQGGRLREIIMQINENLSGSRFLRDVNLIGGVTKDINENQKNKLITDMENIHKDFDEIITIAENSISLLNRLKSTGRISLKVADEHGVMGVAGRASGIANDTRVNHPYAAYQELMYNKIPNEKDGDVYARFMVRVKEVSISIKLIQTALQGMPLGPINVSPLAKIKFKKSSLTLGLVEGWRGEIFYFVMTDARGNINRVALRDPSFINWTVLGHATTDNIIPDFPLINKSFNLSYSGNDL